MKMGPGFLEDGRLEGNVLDSTKLAWEGTCEDNTDCPCKWPCGGKLEEDVRMAGMIYIYAVVFFCIIVPST